MRAVVFALLLSPWFGAVHANAVADNGGESPFELVDGDRVIFLGNTLVERAQNNDFWETALATRWPDRKITFRNLGWSGDTVFGHARAGFGDVAAGFAALRDEVLRAKPTVLIVAYGLNESFAGEAGRADFRRCYAALLDALAPAKARTLLVTPPSLENAGPPLPDPVEQNNNLDVYSQDIRALAEERNLAVIDFWSKLRNGSAEESWPRLTYNGLHLSDLGYWRAAEVLESELRLSARNWRVEFEVVTDCANVAKQLGSDVSHVERTGTGLRFVAQDDVLPFPPQPVDPEDNRSRRPAGRDLRVLRITGLPEGKYSLRIDRREVVTKTAAEWGEGVVITAGPEFDQVEEVRQATVQKNRLFFHRWRPQNETYLLGFRKHEQGQNAREIPMFDPLVEKQEGLIFTLGKPVERYYELERVQ